ncbi:hypothetical protein PQX77_000037 [Marasmius sp. AFHP31]|nr:hypothetical protein PQX77_000037 [Marasmius sp. AFHP31]
MRVKHTPHSFEGFPVYSSTFISDNQVVFGGGGGASKSGIKNKLASHSSTVVPRISCVKGGEQRLYAVGEDLSIDLQDEFELAKGEDAPMSMAAHPKASDLACGVNSAPEQVEKGLNENCRVFNVKDKKISLVRTQGTLELRAGEDDFQKVTVFSPDGTMLAVAGPQTLHLLAYPSLAPIASPVTTEKEIYDVTFLRDNVIVATTANLQVYSVPEVTETVAGSNANKKGKQKAKNTTGVAALKLEKTIDVPSNLAGSSGGTFRSVRQHPTDPDVLYTVINTAPPRTRSKSAPRQGYVCKWDTKAWTVEKSRKVGDKGLVCFSSSPDGKFLGYGSSDLSVGLLDANTLASVSTILKAHDFPPTTVVFNPTSKLLISSSADNSIRVVRLPEQVASSGKSSKYPA